MTILALKAQKGTKRVLYQGQKAVSNELMLTYKVQLTQALKGNEHTLSTKKCYKIKFTSNAFFLAYTAICIQNILQSYEMSIKWHFF